MAAARRIDDVKIDELKELVREQTQATNEALGDLRVSIARVEERLIAHTERSTNDRKEIESVKTAQRWVVFTVLGALLTSIVNFFFRGD
ncbi:MAG: hypothetical protein LBO72_08085 [Helicobacteraceae bacterium]|jgi:predicted  nucleic acid-binding Zn-ribbon protein|nr:hypothetical protein [Helicobacteraceae bacterium]